MRTPLPRRVHEEGRAWGGISGDAAWNDRGLFDRPPRTGVFRALYDEVIRRARSAGAVGVRLYVERANRVAQSTYAALGMRSSDYLMFETIF